MGGKKGKQYLSAQEDRSFIIKILESHVAGSDQEHFSKNSWNSHWRGCNSSKNRNYATRKKAEDVEEGVDESFGGCCWCKLADRYQDYKREEQRDAKQSPQNWRNMWKEEVLDAAVEHWGICPWEWKKLGHFELQEVEGTFDLGQDVVVGDMHRRRWESRGSMVTLIQFLALVQYEAAGVQLVDLLSGQKDIPTENQRGD